MYECGNGGRKRPKPGKSLNPATALFVRSVSAFPSSLKIANASDVNQIDLSQNRREGARGERMLSADFIKRGAFTR